MVFIIILCIIFIVLISMRLFRYREGKFSFRRAVSHPIPSPLKTFQTINKAVIKPGINMAKNVGNINKIRNKLRIIMGDLVKF